MTGAHGPLWPFGFHVTARDARLIGLAGGALSREHRHVVAVVCEGVRERGAEEAGSAGDDDVHASRIGPLDSRAVLSIN